MLQGRIGTSDLTLDIIAQRATPGVPVTALTKPRYPTIKMLKVIIDLKSFRINALQQRFPWSR